MTASLSVLLSRTESYALLISILIPDALFTCIELLYGLQFIVPDKASDDERAHVINQLSIVPLSLSMWVIAPRQSAPPLELSVLYAAVTSPAA